MRLEREKMRWTSEFVISKWKGMSLHNQRIDPFFHPSILCWIERRRDKTTELIQISMSSPRAQRHPFQLLQADWSCASQKLRRKTRRKASKATSFKVQNSFLSAKFKLPPFFIPKNPLASSPSKLWPRLVTFGQATIKSFNREGQSAFRKFSGTKKWKKWKKWKKSHSGKKIKSINKISQKTLMACSTRKTADENFQAAEICDDRWEEADLYTSLVTRAKTRTGTLHVQRMCSSCSCLQKGGGFTK